MSTKAGELHDVVLLCREHGPTGSSALAAGAIDGRAVAVLARRADSAPTEPPDARLRDKLDRYEELALALEAPLTLLFVAPAERRERHILDGLHPTGDVRVLTTTAERHDADPLAANWLTAGAARRVALAALAAPSAAPGTPPGRDRLLLFGSSAGPQRPELTITEPDEPPT